MTTGTVDPKRAATVAELIPAMAAAYGDREAVVGSSGRITYDELERVSARWARGLLARGVGKGSRIGLWLGNGVEWVVAWAAVSRVGAVAVPLSTFFRGPELARVVRHGDLQGVFTHRSFLGDDRLARMAGALDGLDDGARAGALGLRSAPFLRWVVAVDGEGPLPAWASPLDWLTDAADHEPFDDAFLAEAAAEVHPSDVALMIYTSGSTADAKGVPHTHGGVMTKTHYLREWLHVPDGARSYTASPFFWVGGLTMSLFLVLTAGGTQLCTDRFEPQELLDLIAAERVDRLQIYPHHIEALLAHPGFAGSDRSSLREADPRLLPDPRPAPFPGQADALRIGLGMTETFGGYWWGRPDPTGPAPALAPGERRPPPLDVLQPGVELKVAGPDGKPVADGERGEICIRGACITPGLHKADRADRFDVDGWFHTGDLGEVAGARVHFRGRIGDMIKTAGANVSPAEVAAALRALDGVAEAYVLGLPDAVRGEVVVAAVVPAAGVELEPDALRDELRSQLSTFKVPAHIELLASEDIPWTASFKVRTGLLGALLTERMGRAAG